MKKIILISLLIISSLTLTAQTHKLYQIDDDVYRYICHTDGGEFFQSGIFIETSNGKLVKHSYWKDFNGNRALFNRGKMVWYKPDGKKKLYSDDIKIMKLEFKLNKLQQKIESLQTKVNHTIQDNPT